MSDASAFPTMDQVLEGIFKDAPEYLVVLDPEMQVQTAGASFRSAIGMERGEMISFLDTVERFSLSKVRRAFEELRNSDGGHRNLEILHRGADNVVFTVAYSWVACLDGAGTCRAFAGIGRRVEDATTHADVTTLRQQLQKTKTDMQRRSEEIGKLRERLQDVSREDNLTELGNRKFVMERLEGEIERAVRYDAPLTVMILDVDGMTAVNDNHGREAGDKVLQAVAGMIKDQIRGTDIAARYDGEEFVILCPHTDRPNAQFLAERLRRRVAEMTFEGRDESFAITISLGLVTVKGQDETDVERVLAAAESALGSAKMSGANRVKLMEIS